MNEVLAEKSKECNKNADDPWISLIPGAKPRTILNNNLKSKSIGGIEELRNQIVEKLSDLNGRQEKASAGTKTNDSGSFPRILSKVSNKLSNILDIYLFYIYI